MDLLLKSRYTRTFTLASTLIVLVASLFALFLFRMDKVEAGIIPDATVDNFCATETAYGFYEHMYIDDGATNKTFNIAPGTNYIDTTFSIETWFCKSRPSSWWLRTFDYRITEGLGGTNRMISSSRSEIYTYPSDPVRRYSPAGHKEMVISPVNTRISVAGWADGSTHTVCTYHDTQSGAPSGWIEPDIPYCINITIRYSWSLSATSSASVGTASPGDTVTWNHTIRNDGPGATTSSVGSNFGHSGGFTGWPAGALDYLTVGSGVSSGSNLRTKSYTYTIQPGDAGKTLCMWAQYDPTNSSGGRHGRSTPACVTIANTPPPASSWSLSATSSASRASASPGDTVTWNHAIRNNGPDATTSGITTSFDHSGGFAGWAPGPLDTSTTGSGIASGSNVRTRSYTYTVQAGDAGKTLCMWARYDPTNSSGGRNGQSTPACVSIGASASSWSISATSTASVSTANPGDTVTWNHTIRNNGPDATSTSIGTSFTHSGGFAGWAPGSLDYLSVASGVASGANLRTRSYSYTVQVGDIGNTLCMWARYDPTNSSGGRNGQSTPACVSIVGYDYSLEPWVSSLSGETVEIGEDIKFAYGINKSGTTSASDIEVTVQQFAFSSPNTLNRSSPQNNVSDCLALYGQTCAGTDLGKHNITTSVYPVLSPTATVPTSGKSKGDVVCQILTVKPASSASSDDLWSAPVCVIVSAKPYFKVFNGDVASGVKFSSVAACDTQSAPDGRIRAFNKGSAGSYAGSGSQVAAFAYGAIEMYASASRNTVTVPKGLSFANKDVSSPADPIPNAEYGGGFGKSFCIPDYFAGATVANVNAYPAPTNNLNITVPTVRYYTGDVYIRTNSGSGKSVTLQYNESGNSRWSIDTLPSYWMIVKGNIFIDSQVREMDGVYVALPNGASDGEIFTCATGPVLPTPAEIADPDICGEYQLVVNGAFIARNVEFLRTYGTLRASNANEAATTSTQAGEIFNFSPEVWLSSPIPKSTTPTPVGQGYDSITSAPPIL